MISFTWPIISFLLMLYSTHCVCNYIHKRGIKKKYSNLPSHIIDNLNICEIDKESNRLSKMLGIVPLDYYGVGFIIGINTALKIQNKFPVIEIDLILNSNLEKPIQIYTLPPCSDPVSMYQHKKLIKAYRNGGWKAVRFYINGYQNTQKDGLIYGWNGKMTKYYNMILDRVKEEVPSDWDGVYRLIK